MSTSSPLSVEARYRRFLLWVALGLFAATPVELWLVGHTESWQQWVPFGLCGLGLVTVIAALRAPGHGTYRALRGAMAVVAAGAAFGVYAHLSHNVEFELEIRPNAGLGDVLWDALQGASPLLAPGILGLAALLAVAATFWRPAPEGSA